MNFGAMWGKSCGLKPFKRIDEAFYKRMGMKKTLWPVPDWHQASLGEQGFDVGVFETELEKNEQKRNGATSFLVIRQGALVWESYADGYDQNSRHYIFSVTKSVLSAVMGIVMGQGYIKSVEQSVVDLLGDDGVGLEDMKDVQLQHLLTMCVGYELQNIWKSQKNLNAEVKAIYDSTPGTSFVYQDEAAHLISKVITVVTGKTVLEWANEFLFEPIGVASHHWPADAMGITAGQAGLEWSARDMARFGHLYLHQGSWQGRQVIPAEWVDVSTQIQHEGGPPVNQGYGYFWWVAEYGGYRTFFAGGFGSQRIFVVPELDLVVVVTRDANISGSAEFYLEDVILPAVKQS